ncbi:MAG TPA: hypothetical protein VJ183_08355 [Chloroflexia bacterium]|nr:hypothetical protein [Chloroflexia bacterium]
MVIETIRKICLTLSAPSLTAGEAAAFIGEIVEDPGESLPITVRPSDSAFSLAEVVRRFGTNEPSYVELSLSGTSTLSVRELAEVFDKYTELLRLHPSKSTRIIFQDINLEEGPCNSAIIAEVKFAPGDERDIDRAAVTSVTVRRNI